MKSPKLRLRPQPVRIRLAGGTGAVMIGALALGAAAIGRLSVGQFKAGDAHVDRLTVGTLDVERIEGAASRQRRR